MGGPAVGNRNTRSLSNTQSTTRSTSTVKLAARRRYLGNHFAAHPKIIRPQTRVGVQLRLGTFSTDVLFSFGYEARAPHRGPTVSSIGEKSDRGLPLATRIYRARVAGDY
ncbi:hypothetical protein ON010_g17443 [Phytophthora cinnamomi]|nr:hypothetical protein ON010_g17443 [Phytophthora cinnamomi]